MEQHIKKLGDAISSILVGAASGKIKHEGQVTRVTLAGREPINHITDLISKGCRAALDQSVEGPMVEGGQRCPSANRLLVAVYLCQDRAIRYDEAYDRAVLTNKFSRELTQYAHSRGYLVPGNRVDVPPLSIRTVSDITEERIEIRWTCSDAVQQSAPVSTSGSRPVNQPSDTRVIASDKVTAESGEGDGWVSEAFTLWVRSGDEEPVAWDLRTPFYFGRDIKNPQFEFKFTPNDQISRDHFSILYLPNQRFCLRNNGKNGTVIVRGSAAVRLYTPPSQRTEAGSARIARLGYGDVIRLQAGPPRETRIVQMAFCKSETSLESVQWADSFEGIDCADVIEPVARRLRESGPPEQYTLICGEQFMGSAITQGIKFAYTEQDMGFVGGGALACVTNFGQLSICWLRADVSAVIGGTPIPCEHEIPLRPGTEITFGADGSEIPPTRVVFEWQEQV